MTEEAKEKALLEIRRLEGMPPVSAEAGVSRNYVDWLLAVPWKKASREIRDIRRAEKVLDEDHYGLEKVKDRILEFLAVRQLVRKTTGTILCFVGPPGVGKTSLARSIARATGRKFVRLSLGGVRDEAEIRGHRRTYIGAFPGQIIQMMRKAGTVNPVILLDEVDKMAADFRGDPAGALLEVLDPEQNHTFHDHYLDVEYDLSKVFFICTANVTHTIPPALVDRMEKIHLSGYTHLEKLEIARQFLVPRQIERHGLKGKFQVEFEQETLPELIERYTREAGVRNLEREIASICRKLARRVLKEKTKRRSKIAVSKDLVRGLLGQPRYRPQRREQAPEVGAASGLAWTEVGGEMLTTEVTLDAGQGQRHPHRPARRRHAGVGAGRPVLRAVARRAPRHRRRELRQDRRPRPRAGGRDSEGRAVGRNHDGDRAGLRLHRRPGAGRRRDDRGDHAAGQGAAGRWDQGEDAGCLPRRDPRGHPARGEREGPRGDPRRGAQGDDLPLRHAHGPGSGARAGSRRRGRCGRRPPGRPTPASTRRRSLTDDVEIRQVTFRGAALREPERPREWFPQVAVAGRSNVGKSSLLNWLFRQPLARVAKAPGKTRTLNFYLVNGSLYLVDLPGYGYAKVARQLREEWGRELASYLLGDESGWPGVVTLVDIRHGPTALDLELQELLDEAGRDRVVVLTKADKVGRGQRGKMQREVQQQLGLAAPPLAVSVAPARGDASCCARSIELAAAWRDTRQRGD